MAAKLLKIPTTALQLGMFVEQLDRPWLETPLPFQGFYLRTEHEITQIRDCCEFVYVDSLKCATEKLREACEQANGQSQFLAECQETQLLHAPSAPTLVMRKETVSGARREPAGRFRSARVLSGLKKILNRPSRQRKNDLTDYRRSVQKAGQTYEQARKVMADVFEDLRAGGELDIPAVEQTIAPVIESVMTSTDAMTCVIRMREQDHYSYNHALATSIWVVVFGKYLGFDPDNLKALGMGGLLLDIGKTRIDSELLFKPPPLEPHELAEVRHHVEYGLEIFRESGKADSRIEDMIRTHHERHDGSGYPDGLSGHAIPVLGRIAGIVDCYNAMTSIRPHSAAKSTYHTMRHLLDQADALFQAEMVERFIQVVGIFPTATLIELNTGEVGVVVEQNRVRRLRPKVMLILDKEKQLRSDFGIIDLGALPSEKDLPDSVWILRGLEAGSFGIDPAEYYL